MFKTIFKVFDNHELTNKLTDIEKEDLSHEIFMAVVNKKISDSDIKTALGKPRYRQRKR